MELLALWGDLCPLLISSKWIVVGRFSASLKRQIVWMLCRCLRQHHEHRDHLSILNISTTMTTTMTNKPLSMSRSSIRKPSRGTKWGKMYSSMGIACFPDKKWGYIFHLEWCWKWWWLLQVRTTIRTIWSTFHPLGTCSVVTLHSSPNFNYFFFFQNNTLSSPHSCALRALGLLLADGAPTVGRGKTFWWVN